MKKKVITFFVLLIFTLLSIDIFAQDDASVTWPCTADSRIDLGDDTSPSLAATVGNLEATNQASGNVNWRIRGYTGTANGSGAYQRWWPHDGTNPISWGDETGEVPDRYVEFTVSPATGNTFSIDSIRMDLLGGGTSNMRANVYYSLDGFVSRTNLNTDTLAGISLPNSGSNPIMPVSYSPTVEVGDGETLSLRIYNWYTGSASTSKYLYIHNVAIYGTTTSTSGGPIVHVVPSGGSIQDTIDSAASGDIIELVDGGIYTGNLSIANKEVIIRASDGAAVKPHVTLGVIQVDGSGTALELKGIHFEGDVGGTHDYFIDFISSMDSVVYVKMYGCDVNNFPRTIIRGNRTAGQVCDTLIFDGCTFYNFGTGSDYRSFHFQDRLSWQYFQFTNSTHATFDQSFLWSTGPTDEVRTAVIDHCTFDNMAGSNPAFVRLEGATGSSVSITNCIITNIAGGPAWSIGSDVEDNIQNSRYFNIEDNTNTWSLEDQFTEQDPQYADAANFDFTIPDRSPLLTAGTDGGAIGDPRWTENSVVPVELTSFTASVSAHTIVLNWSTATELNNNGFEVQRKFSNGGFGTIAFVKGNGTTTEIKNYQYVDQSVSKGLYTYRLRQIDFDGSFSYSNEVEVNFIYVPVEFSLNQNYPNPFNPSTSIQFQIPREGHVTLTVCNMLGQPVSTLVDKNMKAGIHTVTFNATNFATGIYFYRIEADNFSQVKKMMLLK